MKSLLRVLLILLIYPSCSGVSQEASFQGAQSLNVAKQAYNSYNTDKAHTMFKQVWDNPSVPEFERFEAARYYAKVYWRQLDKPKDALKVLEELSKSGKDLSPIYTLKARVLASQDKFEEAIEWAKRAIDESQSEIQVVKAATVYGKSLLVDIQVQALESGQIKSSTKEELGQAYEKFKAWLNQRRDNNDLAKIQLGNALFHGKGSDAWEAWKLFFRVKDLENVHASLMKDPEHFKRALLSLNQESTEDGDAEVIVKGLAESGFLEYAWVFKSLRLPNSKDQKINEIGKYFQYRSKLDNTILEFYRNTVQGKSKSQDLRNAFTEDSKWLFDQLEWAGNKPNYSQNLFIRTVSERFKGLILFNTVDKYYGLHVGQIILDDKRQINQYNQSAQFRYVLLDQMISNGYTTWYADGESSVGGWATNQGYFVQVREDLNREITNVWSILNDPIEKERAQSQIERMSANEEAMARQKPVRYLPGLQLRILLRECQEVVDSLRNAGLEGSDLRYGFITHMERIGQDSKIYAHEGRHSIDMKNSFVSGSENLEFTAKLSEIYFSEKPVFFLATLLGSNMGNGTAHGNANMRIFTRLVKWMEDNKDQIEGFDSSKPTLPQIEKLTDQQVKRAIRSFDPMAN